jgi:transposase
MSHWATAPLDRHQVVLFSPTLDDSILPDHPVRLFDEVLRGIDFSQWESMYIRVVGQPPIHPRLLASGILYGLSLGIRSSRKVEDACGNRLDFIWLMEGRQPDHATICNFRTQFGPQLKSLFRDIGRVGIEMGLVSLNQVMLDGTAIRANNSRQNCKRRATVQEKLAALDQQIEQAMTQAQQQDQKENELYGQETSPTKLPRQLKDLKRRQEKLKQALARIEAIDREQKARSAPPSRGAMAPLADPDSRVLPNKNGGYAPNYTAVLAVDGQSGMILDTQVSGDGNEPGAVLPAVANIKEIFGKKPAQVVADPNFNTGPNLAGLEKEGVEALMPAKRLFPNNPAARADPSQPVAPERQADLPFDGRHKVLDRASFIYDASRDAYACPMGNPLPYVGNRTYWQLRITGTYRVYECSSCAGCPLAGRCFPEKAKGHHAAAAGRQICRDEYEDLRDAMARRMGSEAGKRQYRRRSHASETPFARLKSHMSFRQFLLRGAKKVEMELRWAAIAYNVMKVMARKLALATAAGVPAP